jgi:hypothetical protein
MSKLTYAEAVSLLARRKAQANQTRAGRLFQTGQLCDEIADSYNVEWKKVLADVEIEFQKEMKILDDIGQRLANEWTGSYRKYPNPIY